MEYKKLLLRSIGGGIAFVGIAGLAIDGTRLWVCPVLLGIASVFFAWASQLKENN